MHNNIHISELKYLNKIAKFKLIGIILILLFVIQSIYLIMCLFYNIQNFYNIDAIAIMIISFIALITLFILILIESLKCKQYSIKGLNKKYIRIIRHIVMRSTMNYFASYICLISLMMINHHNIFNVILPEIVTLICIIDIYLNYETFIYVLNQEYKAIKLDKLPIYVYGSKDYLWKALIVGLALVFIGYSAFLMYERGYKGQIVFFSDFLSIIATVFITNYFTDKKLSASRRNNFRNSLYFEDYKTIHNAINFSLELEYLIEYINDKSLSLMHNENLYLCDIAKFNNNLKEIINKLIDVHNKFIIEYVYLLIKNHKNIRDQFHIFNRIYHSMIKFSKKKIFFNKSNKNEYNNIKLLYDKSQRVDKNLQLFINELYDIDNKYKRKVE